MRHVLIGDIHGCLTEFQELIDKLSLTSEDRVVCLGDFMDKGPEPAACVRFARESGFSAILGNHEDRHLKWRRNAAREKVDPKYTNNMRSMIPKDLEQHEMLSEEDFAWLQALPITLRVVPGYVAVHGGLLRSIKLDDQPADKILRARWVDSKGRPVSVDFDSKTPRPAGTYHWSAMYDGHHHVIYGHEPHSLTEPKVDESPSGALCYGIDTGCVHGGRLTAMVLENFQVSFVQVQSKRKYAELHWADR